MELALQPDLKESLNLKLRKFVPNSLVNQLKKQQKAVKRSVNVSIDGNPFQLEPQGIRLS